MNHRRISQMNQNTLQLNEGSVILQYPTEISPESYEDLKDWLDLMARRVRRAVQAPDLAAERNGLIDGYRAALEGER